METNSPLIPTLKEVNHSAKELILTISQHPAVIGTKQAKKDETLYVNDDSLESIDEANKFVADVEDRIKTIYKSMRLLYSKRFPELKIEDPMQYILTAQLLGNQPEKVSDEQIKTQMGKFLDLKMQLFVSLVAAATKGVELSDTELGNINQAAAIAIHLSNLRLKFIAYVERHMNTIAPNLSAIVGATIAAKLLGLAGGLSNLAVIPSCSLKVGSKKLSQIETSSTSASDLSRAGLLYECDIIQKIPFENNSDVRKKAVTWIANKCVLAARCDLNKNDQSGLSGRMFRDKIESQIAKELEPPPKKAPRPLPAPIEKSGKRRGGKRARRNKERYAQTELRKAANRMNFGEVGDDAYQDDLGLGRSQVNAQKLRATQINDKTRIRLSKGTQKRLAAATRLADSLTFSASGAKASGPSSEVK